MPDLHLLPAGAIPPAQLHAAFNGAFADYLIGPFSLSLDQWPRFLARQGIDLARSRVAVGTGGIQAFAFAAPRSDHPAWRLGTMGALPAARGSGAAQVLLEDFLARARAEQRVNAELECFAQNQRGLRLYQRQGFTPVCELFGYQRAADAAGVGPPQLGVEEVDLQDAYGWISDASVQLDLPMQVTAPSLQAQPVALQAWRCGSAQLVAAESAPAQLMFYSLVDRDPAQGDAGRLVQHLLRCFPQHAVQVPQLQRDDLGGRALQRLGFRKLPLHQLLLRRPL